MPTLKERLNLQSVSDGTLTQLSVTTVTGSASTSFDKCHRYTGSGGHTLTLPAIDSGSVGKSLEVRHSGSGTLTIDGDGSDTVEDALTQDLYAGESIVLRVVTATAWEVI